MRALPSALAQCERCLGRVAAFAIREYSGRGAVHFHGVVWSADVEKLKRSNENVKARCFSLFAQLAEAQAHIQALEVTVKSLQAMNDLMSYIVLPQYRATDKTPSTAEEYVHKYVLKGAARAAARREM